MNITTVSDRLVNGKWMMHKASLLSLYDTVHYLADLRTGGIWGKLAGNPVLAQGAPSHTHEIEPSSGDISVIEIKGILVKGATPEEEELLGYTNIDAISTALDEVANDPTVKAAVLAFASPGGETPGIEELGRKIKEIDATKPIFAWSENMMQSAAYWLGSQTRFIGMSPSANVGSIGCYMLLMDKTEAAKQAGVQAIFISSGKYKLMGHDLRILTDEEKAYLDADVVKQHEKFKNAVLSNRPNANKEAFEGLSYEGQSALEYNLVDVVTDNFNDFVSKLKI